MRQRTNFLLAISTVPMLVASLGCNPAYAQTTHPRVSDFNLRGDLNDDAWKIKTLNRKVQDLSLELTVPDTEFGTPTSLPSGSGVPDKTKQLADLHHQIILAEYNAGRKITNDMDIWADTCKLNNLGLGIVTQFSLDTSIYNDADFRNDFDIARDVLLTVGPALAVAALVIGPGKGADSPGLQQVLGVSGGSLTALGGFVAAVWGGGNGKTINEKMKVITISQKAYDDLNEVANEIKDLRIQGKAVAKDLDDLNSDYNSDSLAKAPLGDDQMQARVNQVIKCQAEFDRYIQVVPDPIMRVSLYSQGFIEDIKSEPDGSPVPPNVAAWAKELQTVSKDSNDYVIEFNGLVHKWIDGRNDIELSLGLQ